MKNFEKKAEHTIDLVYSTLDCTHITIKICSCFTLTAHCPISRSHAFLLLPFGKNIPNMHKINFLTTILYSWLMHKDWPDNLRLCRIMVSCHAKSPVARSVFYALFFRFFSLHHPALNPQTTVSTNTGHPNPAAMRQSFYPYSPLSVQGLPPPSA